MRSHGREGGSRAVPKLLQTKTIAFGLLFVLGVVQAGSQFFFLCGRQNVILRQEKRRIEKPTIKKKCVGHSRPLSYHLFCLRMNRRGQVKGQVDGAAIDCADRQNALPFIG